MTDRDPNPANLRAQLEALIEAGESATPRPWRRVHASPGAEIWSGACYVARPHSRNDSSDSDANYIALAANLAPALARFALAVRGEMHDMCSCTDHNSYADYDCPRLLVAALERELGEVSGG